MNPMQSIIPNKPCGSEPLWRSEFRPRPSEAEVVFAETWRIFWEDHEEQRKAVEGMKIFRQYTAPATMGQPPLRLFHNGFSFKEIP